MGVMYVELESLWSNDESVEEKVKFFWRPNLCVLQNTKEICN